MFRILNFFIEEIIFYFCKEILKVPKTVPNLYFIFIIIKL